MIAASTYLPRTSSSTIAASSIQGTGAQNFAKAILSGFDATFRHRVRPGLFQLKQRLGVGQAARRGGGRRAHPPDASGIEIHGLCAIVQTESSHLSPGRVQRAGCPQPISVRQRTDRRPATCHSLVSSVSDGRVEIAR